MRSALLALQLSPMGDGHPPPLLVGWSWAIGFGALAFLVFTLWRGRNR